MNLPTGNPRLDAYLARGYEEVRGMSSGFAASIAGHLIRRQSEMGIGGHLAEIGTFEGRFFIAMALGLKAGEHAIGVDVFTWPSEKVLDNLHAHCRRFGLGPAEYTAIKGNTRGMTGDDLLAPAGGGAIRFFHIDGEHDDANVTQDLDLAAPLMHPHGLICLDDMLHPGYPELTESVHRWLRAHPEWRVLAILDREDIVAAAKYVLCRVESVALYEKDLLEAFAAQVFPMGAECVGHFTMVLTPTPRLAIVD
ncbi:MAG: class I SAM-dependent methyltransferase [Beijerinckiaceae bacterium]|nr:class I SAM-dependent methyltransferase [Beijerinckiaceae bacterium]MCZ8301478.1 class I SAM-dependent methyltransferase [Beijerinckiaceae bacterium]